MEKFYGLSSEEVAVKHAAGLVNHSIESASPSYWLITLRNIFNLINIFLLPLLIILFYFEKYQDVFVMSTFAVINSIVGTWDEIRIKRRLDKIQVDFAKKVKVVRDGKTQEILATEIVVDDVVKIREGEGIPTDGIILEANNLQVDESLLTGESNYIAKEEGEKLIGGSFIIAGECTYRITSVGKDSYVNKLGFQSKAFRKERSHLQKIGDKLTIFFVISSVIFGVAAYLSASELGQDVSEAVIPLTTVVSLIIPQTLIFLFTFTFSISVVKLSQLGALVQRPSAVESLAKLDILCFDKTGTITSGDMEVVNTNYWNVSEEEVIKGFNYLSDKVFGRNKTFETVANYYRHKNPDQYKVVEFTQIPFNSKTKLAVNQFKFDQEHYMQFVYGAPPAVMEYIDESLHAEVQRAVSESEEKGRRNILGVISTSTKDKSLDEKFTTKNVWLISMKENLNAGIAETLQSFKELGTDIKIISGDSYHAINRALGEAGVSVGESIELSSFKGKLEDIVNDYNIFSRAKPEDKLTIIRTLQAQGKQVGMVGDGVNDVLALKTSNLSIAMESGASIAQDVSDIVLLKNNFQLVPRIIYEGDNVIANLKFMNLLFLNKTFHAILFAVLCVVLRIAFPLLPASILIYSFLATSLPSYAIAFFRRHVKTSKSFWAEVLPDSIIAAFAGTIVSGILVIQYQALPLEILNTAVMYGTFIFGLLFTTYELWDKGYFNRWFHPLMVFVVLLSIGAAASLVPIINDYYNIISLGLDIWANLLVVGFAGFGGYLIFQLIWNTITKDNIQNGA